MIGNEEPNRDEEGSSLAAGDSPKPAGCRDEVLSAPTLRLLSPAAYMNTLNAVVAPYTRVVANFVRPEEIFVRNGFRNSVSGTVVTAEMTDVVFKNAQVAAAQLAANRGAIDARCGGTPTAPVELDCVTGVLAQIGRRAFRRPLTAAEIARYQDAFKTLRKKWGFEDSLRALFVRVLGSPSLFYRSEVGAAVSGRPGLSRLTAYELASALSYAVTDGPPDDALMAAAAGGMLERPAEVQAQVGRLLDAGRLDGLANFFKELFGADEVLTVSKDAKRFPAYTAKVPELLLQSYMRQARLLVADPASTFDDFMIGSKALVQKDVASFFGTQSAATDFEMRDVGVTRVGLYTHPAFLAVQADDLHPKPLFRSRFIVERALCIPLPPPPPEAANAEPDPDPTLTPRQRFAKMTSTATCSACHRLLNPISYAYESFDAVGRYQTKDDAGRIDPSGVLPLDPELRFSDMRSLLTQLNARTDVRQCFVGHWFSYLLGRGMPDNESCAARSAFARFEREGWKIQSLLREILGSEAFRLRQAR